MKKWQLLVLLLAVAVAAAGVGAYAATSYGTQTDPLVTLSYLTGTLEPSLRSDFDSRIDAALERLERAFEEDLASATGAFTPVSLAAGETLTGAAGCEILFRTGTVSAVGTLVDVSTGGTVADGGALTANHLYLASDSGCGVRAAAAATLLVRGAYGVE